MLHERDLLCDFFSQLDSQVFFHLEIGPQVLDGNVRSFSLLLNVLFATDTILGEGIFLGVGAGELSLKVCHLGEVVGLLVLQLNLVLLDGVTDFFKLSRHRVLHLGMIVCLLR